MPATPIRADAEIRARIETLAQALSAKQIDAVMAHYAPETVTFDLRAPLQIQGADAYRKNFEAWFASVQGPIEYELRDVRITMGAEVAFCHSLGHVKSTRIGGEKADYWVRVTSGFRKLNGRWLIVHEHISMPLNMETMQAAPDLQP